MTKRILLLGPDKLEKEFVISAQHRGQHIIACDSYAGAPTMQVTDEFEVFDMLNGEELECVMKKHRPDIIVPETKTIRTEHLYNFEKEGIQIIPNARAVDLTMNRKAIRSLAVQELGPKTTEYFYTKTLEELKETVDKIGFPCVVKPLMSPSDKGQSLVKDADGFEHVWEYGCGDSRGDIRKLVIEEFTKFGNGITLLTVAQKNGPTLFYPPIRHVQKGGDHHENSQPAYIDPARSKGAKEMAEKVTRALAGAGLWGVEFFLSHDNGVYFSELSLHPHDTGTVTLAGTQNLNEFELHLHAMLSLPIPGIKQERIGASAVILSPIVNQERPQYRGLEGVTKGEDIYLRIFGKPFTRINRRMGVVLYYAPFGSDLDALRNRTKRIVEKVEAH